MQIKSKKLSIEISPTDDVSSIPQGVSVFIRCMMPQHNLHQIIIQARRCVQHGLIPTAHIAACHFNRINDLITTLDSLYKVGCQSVLVMRGNQEPVGSFKHSQDLLETGIFEAFKVGVVADPEQTNDKNLAEKLAKNPNISFVVTQWCESKSKIQKLINWSQKPVYLGVPGLACQYSLLTMASKQLLENQF